MTNETVIFLFCFTALATFMVLQTLLTNKTINALANRMDFLEKRKDNNK